MSAARRALRRRTCGLAVVAALLAPLAARADDAARWRSIVDTTIRPLMARHDIPGMAVALTVDGQASVFNYGLASRQHRTPVGASTIFEIGSVSKMFTTTLAAYAARCRWTTIRAAT